MRYRASMAAPMDLRFRVFRAEISSMFYPDQGANGLIVIDHAYCFEKLFDWPRNPSHPTRCRQRRRGRGNLYLELLGFLGT